MKMLAALLSLIIFISISASRADTCDPSKILRQNVSSYQSNVMVFLSYVNSVEKSDAQASASGAGISYAGIGVNWNDARSISQFLETHEDYKVSTQQSVSVMRSTLSDESVKAYIACLNAGGLAIAIPDAAMSEEVFQLRIFWNPKGNIPEKKHTLAIRVTNGKIQDASGQETVSFSTNIDPNYSVPLTVSRDLDKALFITAVVDNDSDLVSIPARPQFLVKWKVVATKEDALERSDNAGLSVIDRDECISAEPDAILLPSTAKFVGQTYGPDATAKPNPDKSNAVSVCGVFHAHSACRTHDCDAGIHGHFSVVQLYTEARKH